MGKRVLLSTFGVGKPTLHMEALDGGSIMRPCWELGGRWRRRWRRWRRRRERHSIVLLITMFWLFNFSSDSESIAKSQKNPPKSSCVYSGCCTSFTSSLECGNRELHTSSLFHLDHWLNYAWTPATLSSCSLQSHFSQYLLHGSNWSKTTPQSLSYPAGRSLAWEAQCGGESSMEQEGQIRRRIFCNRNRN